MTYLKRHWRLIIFTLGIFIVFWLLYALRSAILPFIVGLVIADILIPVISWLEKKLPSQDKWRETKRVAIIIFSFLIILGLFGLLSFYIITTVISSFTTLLENAPEYATTALQKLQDLTEFIQRHVPPQVQQQIDQAIQNLGTAIGDAVKNLFIKTIALVPTTFGMVLGFGALPLFLFYILKDWGKLRNSFYSWLTPWAAEHVRNIALILNDVLGRYIRAQLLLAFTVGTLAFIGLVILQVQFAPVLALFAGVTEVIPTLGPWLGGTTAVIVTLASTPEKAIWVAVLYIGIQFLENILLVPRIHAGYMRIHPAIVVVLLVVGAYLAGFWGLILAVPMTAVFIQIFRYISQVLRSENIKLDTTNK